MGVITRFAPSPTGFLHVGSARTALFNWIFARHMKGQFILRIEDTDKERSESKFEEEILESLEWLGMNWDGEIHHQSKRFEIYKKYADKLVKEGKAYPEGEALKFKMPLRNIAWTDVVRKKVEFDGTLLGDLVIRKSDGSPTYNFACVVDDGLMGITHVIRGEDHISNTPKQLPLYEALGFEVPEFAHIPLILGEDRSRLSKRHGAASIREFRQMGYLPDALRNYLSLLGWSPGQNQELIARDDLIQKFTLERVLSTGAIFNMKKMDWMNGEYVRMMPPGDRTSLFRKALKDGGVKTDGFPEEWWDRFSELYKERVFRITDLPKDSAFFFREDIKPGPDAAKVFQKCPEADKVFTEYADILEKLSDFSHDSVEKASRDLMKKRGLSGKQFIHPARVAVTGQTVSPGFFETLSLIGKEKSVRCLRKTAEKLAIEAQST